MTKEQTKVDLMEAFREYAKKEKEFIENSDPTKVYHRVLPNVKDKEKGSIDFLYKRILVGGLIDKDTIYLNKLISKYGKEEDIDKVIDKITKIILKGDMKLVNQLWYNN